MALRWRSYEFITMLRQDPAPASLPDGHTCGDTSPNHLCLRITCGKHKAREFISYRIRQNSQEDMQHRSKMPMAYEVPSHMHPLMDQSRNFGRHHTEGARKRPDDFHHARQCTLANNRCPPGDPQTHLGPTGGSQSQKDVGVRTKRENHRKSGTTQVCKCYRSM